MSALESQASAAFDYECIRQSHLVSSADLLDEVGEACDELLGAVKTGSAELVGAVVLAVHVALIERLAARELEQELEAPIYAAEAARRVLRSVHPMANTIAAANGRHNARRFTGESITEVGALS